MELMVSTCPNLRKMNLVVHYKTTVVEVMITISLLIISRLFFSVLRLTTPGCGAPC